MRDVVLRWLWPNLLVVALAVALGVLTVISWRSKRGSRLHGARLAVLASLVSLSMASCGGQGQPAAEEQGGAGQDGAVSPPPPPPPPPDAGVPPEPMCYAPMVETVRPDGGAPNESPPSSADAAVQPATPPDAGVRPMPTCYRPMMPPPRDVGPAPITPRDVPPVQMCYAPQLAPTGPVPPPDAGAGQAPPRQGKP